MLCKCVCVSACRSSSVCVCAGIYFGREKCTMMYKESTTQNNIASLYASQFMPGYYGLSSSLTVLPFSTLNKPVMWLQTWIIQRLCHF